jgi:predicted DNA-binding protein
MAKAQTVETITAADQAAAIVEGTGETTYIGTSHVVSVRIPGNVLCAVQALANVAGKTRNSMFITLIEVGLEEVTNRLSDETLKKVGQIEFQLASSMLEVEE